MNNLRLTIKVILSLIFISLALPDFNVHAVPTHEREALIALYNSTNGDNWTNNTNWLGTEGTECSWYGINYWDGYDIVRSIDVSQNQLNGSLTLTIWSSNLR